MPIYVYECPDKHITERVKSIKVSDKVRDNDVCDCGGKSKLVPSHTATPIFVGGGFHCTTYGAPYKGS